jgi:tryptophan synthase alpha chain
MTRLTATFAALKAQNRAGLVTYVMAHDPDAETSLEVLKALPAAGADIIELGFPFTDPMADGPAIQAAGQRALAAGGSLRAAMALLARFRKVDQTTPVILMGYVNPVEQLGEAAFADAAAAAGADGAILVDLPPEEDAPIREALAARDLALIRLATPTTDPVRLKRVLDGGAGFLYYVSMTGVTGVGAVATTAVAPALAALRAATDLPIAVGFGVRTPDSAAALAKLADAVVVGSALVEAVGQAAGAGTPEQAAAAVSTRVAALATAVRTARTTQELEA